MKLPATLTAVAIAVNLAAPAAHARQSGGPKPQSGPQPRVAPPPQPRPADPIAERGLPSFETPADYVARIGGILKNPGLTAGAETLGWFAPIHDGRKAAADRARQEANAAIKREMKAQNLAEFNYDKCAFNPDACAPIVSRFSQQTMTAINSYLDAQGRYNAWTDMGNITGKGWTRAEIEGFTRRVTKGATDKFFEKIKDGSKQPNWDADVPDVAGDAVRSKAGEKLAEYDAKVGARLRNPNGRSIQPEFRATDDELQAAANAAAAQGGSAAAVNRAAEQKQPSPDYARNFRSTARDDARRLEDAAARLDRDFDHASAALKSDIRDVDAKSADLLQDILAQAAAASHPPRTEAGPPAGSAAPAPGKDDQAPDHCAGGVFVCPNGLPWPDCTHSEKHGCPPPEYAPKGKGPAAKPGAQSPLAKAPAKTTPPKSGKVKG